LKGATVELEAFGAFGNALSFKGSLGDSKLKGESPLGLKNKSPLSTHGKVIN